MVPIDTTIQEPLPNFIKLWNYGKPIETERKFREILPLAETANDPSYLAQLLTQIARTQSLQGKFDEAHAILDRVENMLTPDLKLARVRYLLERGRTFNSSNHQDQAIPLFEEANSIAFSINEMDLAVDAIHMIAIAKADPLDQVEWNLKGIEMAKNYPSASAWLHGLYNNIGESYLLLKDYGNARQYFQSLAELQRQRDGAADILTVKDIVKATRLSGNPREAIMIIEPVLKKLLDSNDDNGWIREEMAESIFADGEIEKAKPHFLKAFELLSTDDYCIRYEAEKLKHLKAMAE